MMRDLGCCSSGERPFKQLRDWVGEIESFWADQLEAFKAHAERVPKKTQNMTTDNQPIRGDQARVSVVVGVLPDDAPYVPERTTGLLIGEI
jgi:hypothetical protein